MKTEKYTSGCNSCDSGCAFPLQIASCWMRQVEISLSSLKLPMLLYTEEINLKINYTNKIHSTNKIYFPKTALYLFDICAVFIGLVLSGS
jgi:hypothetical protein